MIPNSDLDKFMELLKQARPNDAGCLLLPPNFHGTQTYRAYKFYWYANTGRWPGSLKKTCSTDNCAIHYKEQGHVLSPEDVEEIKSAQDYRGVVRDLSEKFGVSKARISQIRNQL